LRRDRKEGFGCVIVASESFWREEVVEKDKVLSIESRDWFWDCENGIVMVDDVVLSLCEGIVLVGV